MNIKNKTFLVTGGAGFTRLPSAEPKAMAGRSARTRGGNMFYTYVLKSKADGDLYTGWTDNLEDRIKKHNKGLVTATKYRVPLELVYYEACLGRELAIAREKYLKTGFGRNFLNQRLGLK